MAITYPRVKQNVANMSRWSRSIFKVDLFVTNMTQPCCRSKTN